VIFGDFFSKINKKPTPPSVFNGFLLNLAHMCLVSFPKICWEHFLHIVIFSIYFFIFNIRGPGIRLGTLPTELSFHIDMKGVWDRKRESAWRVTARLPINTVGWQHRR